jgi:hypothetical protein
MMALPWLALTVAVAGCDPANDPGPACGYGQRAGDDGVCAAADMLVVDVDQRTDSTCRDPADPAIADGAPACSTRRGIGINACPVRASTAQPDLVVGDCALFLHEGQSPDQTFAGDAGAIIVGLFDGPVTLAPSADGDCYDSDLLPDREQLFLADDEFSVGGLGGADFPGFDLVLTAPEPLLIDRVTEVIRGAALPIIWNASDADRVVIVVTTRDEASDRGARISCVVDDDGDVTIDGTLTAGLIGSDDSAQVFVLRQNGAHTEPEGASVVVEAAATVSDVVLVPLRAAP